MVDLSPDLLIYAGIGIIMFCIGLVLGYQMLIMYYTRRFMTVARDCSESDSVLPIVDELARET